MNSSSGVPPWQDKEDDKDTSHKIKRMPTDLLGASCTFFHHDSIRKSLERPYALALNKIKV
jgi:hypothetical protein